MHVPRELPALLHESLLENTGKGEVTCWPLDGDEARSVGDRFVAIRARVNRRRRARMRRVRSLRRSSECGILRRSASVGAGGVCRLQYWRRKRQGRKSTNWRVKMPPPRTSRRSSLLDNLVRAQKAPALRDSLSLAMSTHTYCGKYSCTPTAKVVLGRCSLHFMSSCLENEKESHDDGFRFARPRSETQRERR